jgi:hypothetical protein
MPFVAAEDAAEAADAGVVVAAAANSRKPQRLSQQKTKKAADTAERPGVHTAVTLAARRDILQQIVLFAMK